MAKIDNKSKKNKKKQINSIENKKYEKNIQNLN